MIFFSYHLILFFRNELSEDGSTRTIEGLIKVWDSDVKVLTTKSAKISMKITIGNECKADVKIVEQRGPTTECNCTRYSKVCQSVVEHFPNLLIF